MRLSLMLAVVGSEIGWEKKEIESIFLFSFPRHAPNYPALSMCMPLTIRV
jgi:hypothetical protein